MPLCRFVASVKWELEMVICFVLGCGSRIEHVCIKCDHPYSVGDKFCEVCGNKLYESEDIVYTATSDDNTQISTIETYNTNSSCYYESCFLVLCRRLSLFVSKNNR